VAENEVIAAIVRHEPKEVAATALNAARAQKKTTAHKSQWPCLTQQLIRMRQHLMPMECHQTRLPVTRPAAHVKNGHGTDMAVNAGHAVNVLNAMTRSTSKPLCHWNLIAQ
jgi:hypothetical protein